MSDDSKVIAEVRENFGKGFARRLRAAGRIPSVLYGHGTDPVHLSLPGHQVSLIVRRANALLDLEIDGKEQLALVKDVQRDPVRQVIEHIDLLVVKKGEKVIVEVPVVVTGESFSGTIVTVDVATIRLEVAATNIPEHVEVDVEGREAPTHITAGDVALPKGATLADEDDLLLVSVTVPVVAEEPEDTDEASEEATEDAPAAE
ncbi:50S ribosomal protein L25/general stress protein Ctc [Microbacterium sp. YY-01]|uniref:50S ribosomal protein L25/general stress protein Ctc n=1 Tax=Microbacterium sp. YY-01 TaxID=3421634 RepID=UPI003D184889